MDMNRKGFTLIELLVVVVVLATLMGIVFRLAGLGDDSRKRTMTIQRIQRVENALSGFYAAYGTYPPVPLHGSRSIYLKTNDHLIQIDGQDNKKPLDANDQEIVDQVEAACRSQPFAARFPYKESIARTMVDALRQACLERANEGMAGYKTRQAVFSAGFDGLEKNPNRFDLKNHRWQDIQLFQFGVMSFLLPRYLFMLDGDHTYYDGDPKCQWRMNNSMLCKINGQPYPNWAAVQSVLGAGENNSASGNNEECFAISNKLSQAVCARWIQNFEGIVSGGRTFYGVDTRAVGDASADINVAAGWRVEIFAPGDAGGNSSSQQYILDGMTVRDGWGKELYYYSPLPYQSYRVWSSGPNELTFPPWIDLKGLDQSDRETASYWMMDDIVQMSN